MIRSSLLPAFNFHWRGCKLPAAFLICCCFILFHTGDLDDYQKVPPEIIQMLHQVPTMGWPTPWKVFSQTGWRWTTLGLTWVSKLSRIASAMLLKTNLSESTNHYKTHFPPNMHTQVHTILERGLRKQGVRPGFWPRAFLQSSLSWDSVLRHGGPQLEEARGLRRHLLPPAQSRLERHSWQVGDCLTLL